MLDTLVWKILLVDDDEDDYLLTREMLAMAHGKEIQLKWASSYESGCYELESGVFDAVLIDYDLGKHTGMELIRQAVAQDYPSPLILITGRGGYEVDLEAMQAGATLYLTKSEINPPLLDRSIRYAIERKQAETALMQARQELEQRVAERTQELARANLELESAQLTLESTVTRRTNELRRANEKLAEQMVELEEALNESQLKEERIARLTSLYLTLSRVNEAIVRTHDREELYARVCSIVAEGGFPLVWIGEIQGQRVVPLAACGSATGYLQEIKVETQGELGQGPTGRSIREDRPVVNVDFATNAATRPWRAPALRYGIHASASFPLHRQGRVIGTFTLYSRQPGAFDDEMVALLEQLSDDISFALDAMEQEQLRARAEEAQRSSEERYRSLFNDMTEGFALHEVICDEQGKPVDYRFLDLNPAFERLTGLKREGVLGRRLSEVVPGEDPSWAETCGRVALEGVPIHVDHYSPGLKQYYDVYVYRPAPMQFAALFMNITDRKLAGQALGETQSRLEALFAAIPDVIVEYDASGELVQANDAALRTVGPDPASFSGGQALLALKARHLDGRPLTAEETPSARALRGETVKDVPLVIQNADGEERVISAYAAPLYKEGAVSGAMALWHDITELKHAEQSLRSSEQRYRKLFDGMQEGFYLARLLRDEHGDPCDFEYLDANPAFERIMGRPRQQIIGRRARELVPNLTQAFLDVFGKVEQTGEPAQYSGYSAAFQQFFETFVFRPAEGQVAVLVNDITERMLAEEKMQQQSMLIELSHEPILTWDLEGGILSWNQGCEQLYGYTRAEAVGRTSHELLQTRPNPLETVIPELLRVGSWSGELHHQTRDGREVIVASRQQLFETGERRLVMETNTDITERTRSEQDLRETRRQVEWLARFPAENPNPVVRVDFEGRILYSNPAASRLPGWRCAVGQPAPGVLLPLIKQAVGRGRELDEDLQMDGGYYSISVIPIPDQGYANIYGRDIARRRLAEQALEQRSLELEAARIETENEKRLLEAVMKALPVGVAITDVLGGSFYTNPAYAQVWGGTRQVSSIDDYGAYQAWWAESGRPLAPDEWASAQVVLNGEEVTGQILEIQRFDGTRGFVINSASPVKDVSGKVVGSAVAIQDITTLRKAQQALRESEQLWATTLASIGDAVITTDEKGAITYLNPVAEKLSGWSSQEAAGRPMDQIFPLVNEDNRQPAENPVEKVLRSGRVAGLANHTALITRHGQFIPIEDSAAPIMDPSGKTLGVVMVFHDVTEKRRKEAALRETEALMRDYAQKLERSNRELQDFASIASHDLQEPLRKIKAFSDLLQGRLQGRLDENESDLLRRMLNAAGRMGELIDSLLTFSRVASKAQPFKRLDLHVVAEEVVAGFEVQIERGGGRVELGELPCLEADPVQMRQLLQNLVGNALKFHRPGVPPVVQVSGKVIPPAESGNGGSRPGEGCPSAAIEVRDNGIGFELKYLERIFRPFERLHGRSEFEGAGMGLAICKKIVERHQGTISADSVVGEGSTFTVTLPLKQCHD